MLRIFDHPGLSNPKSRTGFVWLTALRSLFVLLLAFVINRVVLLGTPPLLAGLAGAAGVWISGRAAFSRITHAGFALCLAALYLGFWLFYNLASALPLDTPATVLAVFELSQHVGLLLVFFFISSVSTWLFWRLAHYVTFELLALIGIVLVALSGHRNFHFDAPKLINDMSWNLGMEPLGTLIALGIATLVFVFAYLFFAMSPYRPIASRRAVRQEAHRSRASTGAVAAFAIVAIGAVYMVTNELYRYFSEESLTRIANGVGFSASEGMSPLGFHSALGGTNQPSALVRLEGDYSENPHTPMLYMRESALSAFNGRELAIANRIYDQDITHTSPREAFVGSEDVTLQRRVPIEHSVYTISDHKDAFAIDYPLNIRQLKNPNPKRFKASYRAYSVAPAYPLSDLLDATPGDQRWDEKTWRHYLEPHPDVRYKDLAEKLTRGVTSPAQKIMAVTGWLSSNAIYTLTPNHDVKPADDPVAPFLFGDLRGYCVHFSHATVYLLRALGIPARIGTGYLTDFSQAKDGHILLRMSDRHAWAEVYLAGFGWVPFDTNPERVESHADSQVDMKLLEELMGMLEPGEEILPESATADDPDLQQDGPVFTPGAEEMLLALAVLVLAALLAKAYLRYGWALPGSPLGRLRRSYVAVLSRLHDLGYRRREGETRSEFRDRVRSELGFDVLTLSEDLTRAAYARPGGGHPDPARIDALRREDISKLSKLPLPRRALGAINPSSIMTGIVGARW